MIFLAALAERAWDRFTAHLKSCVRCRAYLATHPSLHDIDQLCCQGRTLLGIALTAEENRRAA